MKRLMALTLSLLSVLSYAQISDYVPTDGLVGWYPFDGNGLDEGPSGYNMIESNVGYAVDRFDNPGGALSLMATEDYGAFPSEMVITDGEGLTMSIWAKSENWTAGNQKFLLEISDGSCDNCWPHRYALWLGTDNAHWYCEGSAGTSWSVTWIVPEAMRSEWMHLTGTVDMTTQEAKLYINGEQLASQSITTTETSLQLAAGNEQSKIIGRRSSLVPSSREFTGYADDFGIWNRALTSEEVAGLFLGTPPVSGCTDPNACNFSIEATVDDGSCQSPGCTDENACNFDSLAICSSNDCDYTCCPGPGCCHDGTTWDMSLQKCIVANPADINFDGCVQLNDLLDLLSAYGDCLSNPTIWQCGSPVYFEGYSYQTVQIGSQCWFADNLRVTHYRNGDAIPSHLSDSAWAATTEGAVAVYGEGLSNCYYPSSLYDYDMCNDSVSLLAFGRLYNWYAVDDVRSLCPQGWSVPSDQEWAVMEMVLGVQESEAFSVGERGADANLSIQMKAPTEWPSYSGSQYWYTNSSGFSALPSGRRWQDGSFSNGGYYSMYWTSSPNDELSYSSEPGEAAWYRWLSSSDLGVSRYDFNNLTHGYSVRCIKDTE